MSTAQMRRKLKATVDLLDDTQLKTAARVLREIRESNEATTELLNIPGFMASFETGMRDIAAGRVTPVSKLRTRR